MDEHKNAQSEKQEKTEESSFRTRLEERRRSRGREPWMVGVILILVGAVFLLQNMTNFYLNNWWALFILIPAFGSLNRGWQEVQEAGGKVTTHARSNLFGGLVLTAVAAIFLFNLNWMIFGPFLLIAAGIAILLSSLLPK
jgi:cation transport ATPase